MIAKPPSAAFFSPHNPYGDRKYRSRSSHHSYNHSLQNLTRRFVATRRACQLLWFDGMDTLHNRLGDKDNIKFQIIHKPPASLRWKSCCDNGIHIMWVEAWDEYTDDSPSQA